MALTRLGTNAITTVPNSAITLDAAEIPNLDTAKITTGTMADARISAGSVTQHVTATDLTPVRQDVLTLALKQAVQENSTKFNLTNSAICKFEADADFNLAGSTTIVRSSDEYIWSGSETTGQARVSNSLEGNAVRSSADKKFDTHSLYCAADGDYWKSGVIYGVTGMPTTGDFTVEGWFYINNMSSTSTCINLSCGLEKNCIAWPIITLIDFLPPAILVNKRVSSLFVSFLIILNI